MARSSCNTPSRGRRAKLYRDAAVKVLEDDCGVVLALSPDHRFHHDTPEVAAMREMFTDACGFWPWTYDGDRQHLRVLALCFMAAMVEAGDA